MQKPRATGEAVARALSALDLTTLPEDESWTKQFHLVRDMVENGWPALLAALSFIVSTNPSDDPSVEVLAIKL